MYKPTKKTLEKLGFIENRIRYNNLAQSDFLYYEEGKVNACVGSEGGYSYVTFTLKNLSQLKALVKMFLTKYIGK